MTHTDLDPRDFFSGPPRNTPNMPRGYVPRKSVDRYRARTHTSRAAAVAKSRTKNQPVARQRRRMARAPLTTKNASSLAILSRQVAKLQNRTWGMMQYARQTCQFVSTPTGNGNGPSVANPVYMCVDNFYNSAPWYMGTINGTNDATFAYPGGPGTAGAIVWDKNPAATAGPTMNDAYNWMLRTNTDAVDDIQYMPVSAFMMFKIRVPALRTKGPLYFRFDMFQTRRMPFSDLVKYNLPQYGGAYNSLMATDLTRRRQLSKKYHKLISTKIIKIGQKDIPAAPALSPTATDGKTAIVERFVKFNYQFGKHHLIRPDFTGVSSDEYGQTFYKTLDPNKLTWVMISTNIDKWQTQLVSEPGAVPAVYAKQPYEIECHRTLKWRDLDGEAWGGM